jgi:hypothetical protein
MKKPTMIGFGFDSILYSSAANNSLSTSATATTFSRHA